MAYLAHSKRARVDSHDNSQNGSTTGVDHKDRLILRIQELYLSRDFSDIEFVIGPDVVPGHKCIVCVTSVWRQLIHDKTSVELEDTSLSPFKELLRYIYTGRLSFDNYEPEMVTKIRQLAERYEMWDLVEPLQEREDIEISLDNVLQQYSETPVESMVGKACLAFIAHNSQDIFDLDDFYDLDADHFQAVFIRDDLNSSEQIIFEAIRRYVNDSTASDKDKKTLLSTVRLALLSFEYMWTTVRKFSEESSLLSIEELSAVSAAKAKLTALKPEIRDRAICLPNSVDVISANDRKRSNLSAQVLRGKLGDAGEEANTLEIDLGLHYLINGLGVMISGSFKTRYAFKVETSVDNKQWHPLYDFTRYHTSNKLDLTFDPRVIRFLKFSEGISYPDGAKSKDNKPVRKWANVVAVYTEPTGLVRLRDNLLASKYLFADMSCDFTYKNWFKKNGKTFYVCALNDPIVCVLSQPVWMDSISLFLPDDDEEKEFCFTVEVTAERESTFKGKDKSWQMVGNFKEQSRKGDVDVVFEPRVVNAFRVTGTRLVNAKPKEKDFAVEIRI